MRISPIVLLLFVMLGCVSGTQPATPSAKSPAEKAAAAKVKKAITAQLALGDPIVNSVGMLLVPIHAGEFLMGSPDSDSDDDDVQHLVKITKPFYLGAFEVTQSQYEKVMGVRPWQLEEIIQQYEKVLGDRPLQVDHYVQDGPDYPATYVGWHDAVEFCRNLSEQEGVEYRLPTEAEWEYACRAGTITRYSFGNDASQLGQYAWYKKNAWDIGNQYAHRVGQKLANSWGLYDMHGNVLEWCHDWYAPYGSEKVLSDPKGPAHGKGRVLRGGSIGDGARVARSAYRFPTPDYRHTVADGFRVARTYP